jgi:hypothetical protein
MTGHQWRASAGARAHRRVRSFAETMRTAGLKNELDEGAPPISGEWGAHCSDLSVDLFGKPGPAPNSPTFEARAAIWRDQANGLISIAEAQKRSAAIGAPQARNSTSHAQSPAPARPRHSRPAPNVSRQYAPPMSTTAARDDRLTPQAKALLQVIRARCGKGTQTTTTKGTLAAVLSRSTRSIARYLRDLEAHGYVTTSIRRTGRGFHVGLVVTVLEAVLPFWSETKALGRWLAETAGPFMPFATEPPAIQGMTFLTPKNQSTKDSPLHSKNWLSREVRQRPPAPS